MVNYIFVQKNNEFYSYNKIFDYNKYLLDIFILFNQMNFELSNDNLADYLTEILNNTFLENYITNY